MARRSTPIPLGSVVSAAFAVLQLRGYYVCAPWVAYTGVAPSYLAPTTAALERVALASATVHRQHGQAGHFVTDCASAAMKLAALRAQNAFGNAWGALWRQVNPIQVASVRHIRARQAAPPHGSVLGVDVDAYASFVVDRLAGHRAAVEAPSRVAMVMADRDWQDYTSLARAVVRRLSQ